VFPADEERRCLIERDVFDADDRHDTSLSRKADGLRRQGPDRPERPSNGSCIRRPYCERPWPAEQPADPVPRRRVSRTRRNMTPTFAEAPSILAAISSSFL
jgi:hypothetical protein